MALLVFLAALIQIYWPVMTGLAHQWTTDADSAHALICVPLAVAFAIARREELRRTIARPRVAGLALAAGGLGLLLLGRLGAELFLTRFSLVALSLIIARTTEHRAWARALIVLSAAPVAVLVNALRVTTTAAATYWYGRGAAEGFVHELVGLAMIIVALALVMSCGRGIARLGPEPNRLEIAG